jgi:putative SOS response-associated peptidase YedK
MCARFVSRIMAAMERVVALRWHDPFEVIYNAAPSTSLSVVTVDAGGMRVDVMKWGFVPGWWRQARPPKLTINARFEEAHDRPMWQAAFRGTRCLVPALGWYEWSTEGRVDTRTGEVANVRQPHFVHLEGLAPLCFAGLWSRWTPDRNAEPLLTFSILTRPPSAALSRLHDRMPVVLPETAYAEWLDPANDNIEGVRQLLATRATDDFRHYPVSTYVNNPRNQGEKCLEPPEPDDSPTEPPPDPQLDIFK